MTHTQPDWFARLYPFRANFMSYGFERIHYLDEGPAGAKEAVVMVHGNPTWSFYYRNVVLALRGKVRCVVPDHLGMGFSSKPQDGAYRLADHIERLGSLIDYLGLERVHLVVHDWGGAIGLGWAGQNPGRVGRIVILNTAAFPDVHIPRRISLCAVPWLGAVLVKGLNGFAWPAARMAVRRHRLPPEVRRAYLLPYDHWVNRIGIHRFVRDIPMHPRHPSWPVLEEVAAGLEKLADKPVLIAWGGGDFCFTDHFYERFRTIFPKAETMHVPDAGHYVIEDAPEVVERVAEFLAGPAGPA